MLEKVYAQASTTFTDPLGGKITDLKSLFGFVMNLVLGVGFSLVLIMLALGFIQYIMSQGDKAGVEKAQKWVTYAVIGGLGLFLVFALRQAIIAASGANPNAVGTGISI